MPHYNEICIEKTTRKKQQKSKKQKFQKKLKLIFPNYTADGIFL